MCVCMCACWRLIVYTWIVCRLSRHRAHYSRTQPHARHTDLRIRYKIIRIGRIQITDWINVLMCVCTLMPVCHLCIYKFYRIKLHSTNPLIHIRHQNPTKSTYATLSECTEAHFRIINLTCILSDRPPIQNNVSCKITI